jgi:predicted esterase
LIIEGTQDTSVPPDQAQELQGDLQAAGVPNNLLWYVGGHAFNGLSLGQADMIREQINAWLVGEEHP